MSKDFQLSNRDAKVPHAAEMRIEKDYKYDEFQKGKANTHEHNQMPLSHKDELEIKGADQNKSMHKDLKGDAVKNTQSAQTTERKFNEMERDIQ